jgi:hypothetical protein
MTQQQASLYLRDEIVYAVPEAGRGDVSWEIPPVRATDPDAAELAQALAAALADSRIPSDIPDMRDYRGPMLDALDVEDELEVQRGTSHVSLTRGEDGFTLSTWLPADDGLGWEPGDDEHLDAGTPIDQVAARTLEVLKQTPRAR